jgi:hypothetical protein
MDSFGPQVVIKRGTVSLVDVVGSVTANKYIYSGAVERLHYSEA